MTTRKSSCECDACRRIIGLWQAVFTSECAHTFHLRCVSGTAACPVCAARWTDTPATAPAPAPATPFTFASTTTDSSSASRTPLFGQPSIAHNSYFTFASSPPPSPSWTPMFGQPSRSTASQAYNLSGPYPPPPLYVGRTRIPEFGQQQAPASPLCPVCHAAMFRGQATVTSECNHTLHLRCIASHYWARSVCPVCSARWRDCVSLALAPHPESQPVFDDDEPVEVEPPSLLDQVQEARTNKDGVVVLKTHCEHPAVARDTARDNFAVLVHAKAPAATAERVPSLDLVTVLDVSGSMAGYKLSLLKQAMSFVIDRLGSRDRLSIVAFSCEARCILRLARMSDGGKATAKAAVESLVAQAGTDIGGGLRVAAEVLDGRRHRNAVASVILLSDGKDNHTYHHPNSISSINRYSGLVPRTLSRTLGSLYPPPVHMFGLGTDHDPEAMHAIAKVTRGTFSFIEEEEVVHDSLAQCIGRLLSVAVQEARVVVECLHPGVHVRAVKSGGRYYPSLIDMGGCAASVDIGELYADEERRLLLFLGVPATAAGDDDAKDDDDGSVTRLIKVSCTYKDAATRQSVDVSCEDDATVQRPVMVPATAMDMESSCVEVARERFRVEAAEDIEAARAASNRGEHARAVQILERRQEASAAVGLAGDDKCAELVAELRELSARVADRRRREYEQTERACLLAGTSSNAQQRASTVPLFGTAVPFGTPAGSTFGATATGGYLFSFGPLPP